VALTAKNEAPLFKNGYREEREIWRTMTNSKHGVAWGERIKKA